MYASKFVLVGDHYQLPPLVQSTEALENGMGVSLFCRLSEAHPQAISALQSQYRMCASIMDLSNALIYGNRLRCGSIEVENAKLVFTSSKYISSWLKEQVLADGESSSFQRFLRLCLSEITQLVKKLGRPLSLGRVGVVEEGSLCIRNLIMGMAGTSL
ncbi:DNA replication ATP-dependent helicase/nuclease jhs1 [Sarracenia purpurea var. burkii]